MSRERKLNTYEVAKIISWGRRWKALKTRRQMALKYGVSEPTITRIVRDGGYVPLKSPKDMDALAASFDAIKTVPRGTKTEDECTQSPS